MWREAGYLGRSCECGILYLDPAPGPRAVDPTRDLHYQGYYAAPAAIRARWVHALRPGGSILEIGCGAGYFLEAASKLGHPVAGVEPHEARASAAESRLGIGIERATLDACQQPDNAFDVVYHVDLLSHFESPVDALAAMARRVRRDGLVCFEVGEAAGVPVAWYHLVGGCRFPEHRWLYTEGGLRRTLRAAGLEVRNLTRFDIALGLGLVGVRRLLWPVARRVVAVHEAPAERAPRRRVAHRLYDEAQSFLRYRAGRIMPRIGPGTMFVAARRVS